MPKSPSLAGLVLGATIAAFIACAAPSKQAQVVGRAGPPPQVTPAPGGSSPREQIAALDNAITSDMQRLQLSRPPAPQNACVEGCAEEMGTKITATATQPANCKAPSGDKCTDACTLKDSICKAAGNICRIASDLGGNDSYANDACNRGTASCDAAKERCCACI